MIGGCNMHSINYSRAHTFHFTFCLLKLTTNDTNYNAIVNGMKETLYQTLYVFISYELHFRTPTQTPCTTIEHKMNQEISYILHNTECICTAQKVC